MMGSNTQNFSRGRKLENNFFQSWISAKLFERFLIVSSFHTFWHFEKCSSDRWKKCVMKFQKSKIWDVHFFRFSVPVVMVYDFFPISIRVWRQIGVENGPFLVFEKNQNLSKRLQKSTTEKNDFLILGRVKSFVGPSTSFSTPDFMSGAFRKGCNFTIASDHKLIFSDLLS